MAFNEMSDMSSFVISFTNDPKGDFGAFAKGCCRRTKIDQFLKVVPNQN